MRLGEIEGASGIGSKEPNSQLTAKGIAEPSTAPEKRADQRDDHELDERKADDARSGRADRLENGERRAFALDETLRRVRDADSADDQGQQSRQRQEFGEAVEIATEVRVDGETRASVPSGLREGPLRLIHESLDGGIVRRAVRTAHDDACRPSDQRARLDQFRRVESRLRNEHARPRPMPVASRSGSLARRVRRAKFASPMRMTSPSFKLSRASSASSTAAPNIPSRSPSASSSDMGGAKTAWPIRGHDGSTALISISAASPLAALAMPRKVATVDSEPCASRKRCSSAERRRWMSANDASPPRITRPSRPMPSLSARARLSTPTIAATPSAMQRRKIRKPARPPRKSRKAKRRVGARVGCGMSPVAGAFTPFSLGEKVAGEAQTDEGAKPDG